MVTKVYKILREKKVETDQQTWNRRYREYTEKIKTGSVLQIATVLRDLFVLKGDKELSFGERKMLDTARNLLVKELSIARSHSEEKIMEELRHIFTH
jgi:CarD family transcriptional regulator